MATIRPAAAPDRSSLFELVRTFPTPTPPSTEQFARALASKLSDASSCLFVAEHEGRLVGYVTGYCHSTFTRPGQRRGSMNCWSSRSYVVVDSVDSSCTRSRSGPRIGTACSCRSPLGALPHSTSVAATPRWLATTRSTLRQSLLSDARLSSVPLAVNQVKLVDTSCCEAPSIWILGITRQIGVARYLRRRPLTPHVSDVPVKDSIRAERAATTVDRSVAACGRRSRSPLVRPARCTRPGVNGAARQIGSTCGRATQIH